MEFPWHILPDIFAPLGILLLIMLSPMIFGAFIGSVLGLIVGFFKKIFGIKEDDDNS